VADGVGRGSIGYAHRGWRLVVTSPGSFHRWRRVVGVQGDVVGMCTRG
jgi:hypothetical protein